MCHAVQQKGQPAPAVLTTLSTALLAPAISTPTSDSLAISPSLLASDLKSAAAAVPSTPLMTAEELKVLVDSNKRRAARVAALEERVKKTEHHETEIPYLEGFLEMQQKFHKDAREGASHERYKLSVIKANTLVKRKHMERLKADSAQMRAVMDAYELSVAARCRNRKVPHVQPLPVTKVGVEAVSSKGVVTVGTTLSMVHIGDLVEE
ncbi:hypothetical protein GLOTRDRAFT_139222 [Gloeophyllum trabeum ATCC 11539]|uniref:Uncharacterized protein n=1 Tax=Gloeophyllum trabeum (strain ATCC 11539 / FP-39264 / Madison 617) TaxID=670483 RepID=S7RJZ4_GLOTA|nr:uncharacterized protein GLOTRDRAFT_139222 [Gloeophyllum trabeum ATCC 11539]EPQ54700.1 hypothetical protein GLOTRDRAFT_139222 [Gloeophyllum trabeum ATCC 11539]